MTSENPGNDSNMHSRLQWACRRGMLELDLLLGQFLDKGYLTLSANEQALFKELLDETDQDLFAWLMGNVPPSNPHWQPLLQKIRGYVPCKST